MTLRHSACMVQSMLILPAAGYRALSSALCCPLVDKDDARDCMQPLLVHPASPCSAHTEVPEEGGVNAQRASASKGGAAASSSRDEPEGSEQKSCHQPKAGLVSPDDLNRISYDIM